MQNSNQQKNTNDIFLLWIFGVLGALFLPIVLLSVFFTYFTWASYRHNEERKHIRTVFIFLIGLLVLFGLWDYWVNTIPSLLILVNFSSHKINSFISSPLFKYSFLAYVPFSGILFVIYNKNQKSLKFYEHIRMNVGSLLKFAHFSQTISVAVIGALIEKATGIKIQKPNLLFWAIYSITGLVVTLVFVSLMELFWFSIKLPGNFILANKTLIVSYFLIYFYDYIARSFQKEPQTFNAISDVKNETGIYVGRLIDPKKMDLVLSWRDVNHHIHIIGQPGSGKSVLLKSLYYCQIAMGEGLLMIDLKADYKVKEDFKTTCLSRGREKDLLIIDLSNPEKSYGYNPLLFGNASEIKDKIIGSFEWSEVHYKKISERVLQTVLSGLVWIRDNKNLIPTLEDLYFSISSVQGLNLLAEKVEDDRVKQNIYSLASEYNKDFLKSLEGLKTDLALLVQSEFGSIFTKNNSLNVFKAIQERKIVLVNLDGQTYGESAKRFGRLILADLRSASGAIVSNIPEHERPRFTVIVDEFSDIVSTDDMARTFVGFLNRCRGSGIGVVIAHQSLGDFKDQTVKSQIIDSTETLFSFVQKDPETCETLASIVGTKQTYEKTMQTEAGLFGDSETGRGTKKVVHEFIYHPNIFRSLGVGQAVYIAKKPTRFGIIQANMIELDHQNNDDFNLVYENENYRMLGLQQESLKRKKSYKDAVKTDPDDDGPVDI